MQGNHAVFGCPGMENDEIKEENPLNIIQIKVNFENGFGISNSIMNILDKYFSTSFDGEKSIVKWN